MSSPLTGIKVEIEQEKRRREDALFSKYRPQALNILQELRPKLLEAARNGEEQVFVMGWDWVQEEDEEIEGLSKLSAQVPHGSELQGAVRLVYDECIKEGLRATIEAPDPAEGVEIRVLHMYVRL